MKPRDIDIDIAQNKGRDWYQIVRINISSIKTCSYWLFFDSIFLRFMTSFNADSHGETLQEKNLLYKLISGLHSSISIHIAADYLLDETTNLVSTLPCILQQYSLYNFHSLFWISYCFSLRNGKGFQVVLKLCYLSTTECLLYHHPIVQSFNWYGALGIWLNVNAMSTCLILFIFVNHAIYEFWNHSNKMSFSAWSTNQTGVLIKYAHKVLGDVWICT